MGEDGGVNPASASDRWVEDLMDRAWARSRLSARTRVDRLRDKSWHVVQCALAAAVAWEIATRALGHSAPFLAPVVAVICLGMTFGQRLRRVAEVTVGVAIGVAVADLFVQVAGSGPWQMGVVVVAAMSIALLLDAGGLLVMQSAVQSLTVVALGAGPGQSFGRWLDALVGGAVAVVAAAVAPRTALRQPRVVAARVAASISRLLLDAADSAHDIDVERAARVLAEARDTDGLIRELQAAADEGLSVVQASWRHRADEGSVRTIASVVEPLDRAMRSTRVLVRRVSIAAYHDVPIPGILVDLVRDLADAVGLLARYWGENQPAARARPAFLAVAEESSAVHAEGRQAIALLEQLRSLVVDLLELTGLDHDDAVEAVVPKAE
jgi:uncharacterized membrane protein YgaE (UPF0421/DUF939 family)